MSSPQLTDQERRVLLQIARRSIEHGLDHARPLSVDPAAYTTSLTKTRASFVTLKLNEKLRGCIGALEAHMPLVQDVSEHAYAAAFQDPRFAPVARNEIHGLDISVSMLSDSEPIDFESEADLIGKLRPGVDGLILKDGSRQGTFLPSVWSSLPNPVDFLANLKQKAGLPADYWSDTLRVARYTTESFE